MSNAIGLVGTGSIAAWHVDAMRAAGASVAAVVGRDRASAQAFARAHGIDGAYDDVATMITREQVGCVLVASPSDVHVSHTLTSLQHGAHVLSEVPVATSIADGRRLLAEADRAKRHVMAAHTLRYCRPHRELRDLSAGGQLSIRHLVARRLQLRQVNQGWTGEVRSWTDSVLWHHAAHLVDFVLWLFDTPVVEVYGAAGPLWPSSGRPMDVSVVLRGAGGALATLALSYHSRAAADDIVAIAEDRTVTISGGTLREGERVLVDAGNADDMLRDGVFAQDAAFWSAIRDDRPPGARLEEIMPVLAVLDALANGLPRTLVRRDVPRDLALV
jgi:2-hydroxy-4-carboxymuconate semialdehyde hemiacetal dehydrogenase